MIDYKREGCRGDCPSLFETLGILSVTPRRLTGLEDIVRKMQDKLEEQAAEVMLCPILSALLMAGWLCAHWCYWLCNSNLVGAGHEGNC